MFPATTTAKPSDEMYFAGKGVEASIPKYLRTKNKVLNRNLSKHNTLLLINDTLEAKAAYEAVNSKTLVFSSSLLISSNNFFTIARRLFVYLP